MEMSFTGEQELLRNEPCMLKSDTEISQIRIPVAGGEGSSTMGMFYTMKGQAIQGSSLGAKLTRARRPRAGSHAGYE